MTDFTPTPGQAEALDMVDELLEAPGPAFGILKGYAGTGKTTVLKVVGQAYGPPLVLTPTGKAAVRVREAAGLQASTIHRFLYRPREDPKTGEVRWVKRAGDEIELPANGLIVVDEASMLQRGVWADTWDLARSAGAKVLLVGDTFQLPPVEREGRAWSALALETPFGAQLTEVVRQAQDSPVIRASMMIRAGEDQAMEALGGVIPLVSRADLIPEFQAMGATRAIIAHRNSTRLQLNGEVRRVLGREGDLQGGEPLLVLLNNYQIDRFNGDVVEFRGWSAIPGEPVAVKDRWKDLAASARFGIALVDADRVTLSPEEVFGGVGAMPPLTMARAAKAYACSEWHYQAKEAPSHLSANLGYVLTAHKAQGSEWDDVAVVAEDSVGGYAGGLFGLEGRRWLYTALTRAKKRAIVCF